MAPLHLLVKRLLLVGVRLPRGEAPPVVAPPAALRPLVDAAAAEQVAYNRRAIRNGNRYRSAFWAIYLASALAVLFAALPPALGWDQHTHGMHAYAGLWGVGELVVILAVAAVYRRGHKADWQGQWLAARTHAELIAYLPLVAPLIEFSQPNAAANWYTRVFDPGKHLREADALDRLCVRLEPQARTGLRDAWSDPQFVGGYAAWAIGLLQAQRGYHLRVGAEQHALSHRVHSVTVWLFSLTAIGAALHLVVHSPWLSVVTLVFPALGAALHGALAQSESYRLEQASAASKDSLDRAIADVRAATTRFDETAAAEPLTQALRAAVAVLLEEHQDWHGFVRPHRLPLG